MITKYATKPSHQPTEQSRKSVETMIAVGITQEEIGKVLGITDKTLRKHYLPELTTAAIKANAQVGRALYQRATGAGDWEKASDTAIVWWTKTRMKWKEAKDEMDERPIINITIGQEKMKEIEVSLIEGV